MKPGIVYLVGAGPGDPGLLTLRGAEVLGRADVVYHDALANEALLALAPPTAERVYVGKRAPGGAREPHEEERPWDRNVPQSETTRAIVEAARAGKTVVRLKGGDPYLFGRGGEEAEALAEAGIPFEVVPGVTSAIAAPAYAGIPVTHRDSTSTFAVVTGHEEPAKAETAVDWAALARIGTVVMLMGVRNLDQNLRRLIDAGRDPDEPAAAIGWGTHPRQRVVRSTVGTLAPAVAAAGLGAPSVVVVGKVCAKGDLLDWFGRRPLKGRRIVVTRTRRQAGALARLLAERGAEAVEFPVIDVRPLPPGPAIEALRRGGWDWIVFTSENGVESIADALEAAGLDSRVFIGPARPARLGAIGPATAAALRRRLALRADAVPETFVGEALAAALGDVRGRRVLVLRALRAREALVEALRAAGAEVEVVPVYETVPTAGADADTLRRRIEAGEIDAVTFTSSSTVERFAEVFADAADLLRRGGAAVASIGPVTSATARRLGLEPAVEAARHDVPGLVEALVDRLGG